GPTGPSSARQVPTGALGETERPTGSEVDLIGQQGVPEAVEAGAGRDDDPPGVPAVIPRVGSGRSASPTRPRCQVRVRNNSQSVPRVARHRTRPVHVRGGRGGRADEQRSRAGAAPCRVLAEDQWWVRRDRLLRCAERPTPAAPTDSTPE